MAINVCAPVNDLGYGTVGRNLVKALYAVGADPALFPIGNAVVPNDELELFQKAAEKAKFYNCHAPSFRLWHAWDLSQHPTKGRRSAATFFELDTLKLEEVYQLNQMDQVFAFGNWAKDVMRKNGVTSSIEAIHCGVDRNLFSEKPLPAGGPTRFINAGKWEIRKGHDILLQAFLRAFGPEDDVELVMLCDNPFLSPEETNEWVSYYKNSPLGNKVRIPMRLQTHKEVADLFATCHCGVFPSRGEGWNLEALELLSMGRHVIATPVTAHTDYLNSENSILVPVGDKDKAYDGKWFFGQGNWYQLNDITIETLANAMKTMHRLRQDGVMGLNEVGIETAKKLSWENAARKICETLGVSYVL